MPNPSFELHLLPAVGEENHFSAEYQRELAQFAKTINAPRQRAFTQDSLDALSGPLGEFIFNNSKELITAFATVAAAYIGARGNRKVRMRIGTIEIEAASVKEALAIAAAAEKGMQTSGEDNKPLPPFPELPGSD